MNNEKPWTIQPEVLYFGCMGQSGHYLKSKTNPNIRYHETAWGNELDGGLFPNRNVGYADGIVHYQQKDGWSGIAMADNSVDSRPGSHSTFVTPHVMSPENLLALAKAQWPEVFGRPRFPAVKLKIPATIIPVQVVEALCEKWIERELDFANKSECTADIRVKTRYQMRAIEVCVCRRELQEAAGLVTSPPAPSPNAPSEPQQSPAELSGSSCNDA